MAGSTFDFPECAFARHDRRIGPLFARLRFLADQDYSSWSVVVFDPAATINPPDEVRKKIKAIHRKWGSGVSADIFNLWV